ncbi:MAG: hypothetical protein OXI96_03025 [Acidimicrobiaceae bacterium]|nr:hypothetical protein [Acidimicrobiaceae bacterium]
MKYARSYLYVETDSNDVTYFVIHQLEVIERAIAELRLYLTRKSNEITEVERLIQGITELNHRQLIIISEALRDPHRYFTIAGQQRLRKVAYQSARTDLLSLEDLGLLEKIQIGRKFHFRPVNNLANRITKLSNKTTA